MHNLFPGSFLFCVSYFLLRGQRADLFSMELGVLAVNQIYYLPREYDSWDRHPVIIIWAG